MALANLHFMKPEMLWLLPLAILPLFSHGIHQYDFPGLEDWPKDRLSTLMRWGLRSIAALSLASLLLAAASPFSEGGTATNIGNGAEIVVVFDRSGSMTDPLAGENGRSDDYVSKIKAARQVLLDFMQQRVADTFGVVVFNSSPISVAPVSADRALAEAALESAEARSVGFTALARALGLGLEYFRDRPLTANRIILLVSDGDAIIEGEDRDFLQQAFNRQQSGLIWIYVRGDREPSIMESRQPTDSQSLSMHRIFNQMGMPYQAFEVNSYEGMQKAIEEVSRLTNHPTRYEYRLPRRDLAAPLYWIALICIGLLVWIKHLEISAWQPYSAT